MPKKRKTRRRRRRGGLGRLLRPLSVLLTAVAVVAALTMFFKVSTVEVTGSSRYQAGEVAAASGVELGDNLVLLDKYHIAQRIYTELPYVTEARINRKFPSTLVLDVTETSAVASIQGAGGYWLLNAGEKLLEVVDETGAQDYLRITGLEAVNPAVSARLDGGMDPLDLLREALGEFELEVLDTAPVEYRCYCSRERVSRALISMGKKDLTELIAEQGQAELTCQFCDQVYRFSREELETLLAEM